MEKDFEFIEEPKEEKLVVDDAVEEIVVIKEEPVKEEPVKETSKKKAKKAPAVSADSPDRKVKQIDNFYAELLLGKLEYRLSNAYDEVVITADKVFIGSRVNLLVALAKNLVKEGGILKIAVELLDVAPENATKDADFWIVAK